MRLAARPLSLDADRPVDIPDRRSVHDGPGDSVFPALSHAALYCLADGLRSTGAPAHVAVHRPGNWPPPVENRPRQAGPTAGLLPWRAESAHLRDHRTGRISPRTPASGGAAP